MATMTSHAAGTVCWIELCSRDAEASKRFHCELFGWTTRDTPIPEGVYTMCQLDGHEVAALYQMSDKEKAQGIPSHWFTYIAVHDVDETAARVAELGGVVHAGPFDVMEHGRMAVIQDPTGGIVGLWEAKRHPGVGVRDEPGALCWTELMSPDRERAGRFFAQLIGWERSSMEVPGGEYTVFMAEGVPKAGCMQITPDMGEVPAGWLTYFAVRDCDATVRRVEALGGTLLHGPENATGIGRWAMFQDPTGAVFSAIAPAE